MPTYTEQLYAILNGRPTPTKSRLIHNAKILAAEFNPRGYRVPTGKLPYWLMWIIAWFDKAVNLAITFVGRKELVSAAKAKRELGLSG